MTKKYKLINNITGWITFAVASVVYLLTIEPTTSFWDCPEFITSAYKLEVGHPPGAPFFMLVGNFFTQFASDPSQVAKMVNGMSALLSAFTILFLFWTITHLVRRLVLPADESRNPSVGQLIVIMGSGLVGALAYTFSDTFWFSAVEGEVYAFSSMLTALVFWLILKWEDNADKHDADKWIVFIAYIIGLSIGVHLLNLLCLPAIVLVYYYKKADNATLKGAITALIISFVLIAIIMFGIVPGFTKVGGWFELFFVNTLGTPYNTGVFVYFACLIASIIWSLYETMSRKQHLNRARFAFLLSLVLAGVPFLVGSVLVGLLLIAITAWIIFRYRKISMKFVNLTMSCLLMILIGFSAYAIIPIRSSANPPLDLNTPEDIFALGSYLNREQYGQTPLLYGSTYASQVERTSDGMAVYSEKKKYDKVVKSSPDERDRYIVSTTVKAYKYNNSMLFTRMHSNSNNPAFSNHIQGYRLWGGVDNENVPPTMLQNIRFFFNYQVNFMYWRYFFWNFSGRQNDIQADGGITKGNWITGIPFVDEHLLGLGPQDNIAPDVADNKGRNVYFMLPLLLGIIGIVYQLRLKQKGMQSFSIVFMLYFMTGLAIILYLNQTPYEPRERDYAYAGSFYAFAIWIGLGVAGISGYLRRYLKNNTAAAASVATVACMFIPVLMAAQNWDDHDRSGRYLARDTGMNYLSSIGPDGIIFTNGDNDTYPLWYAQETEGFRTDVRVCNLSFLQTEWYIDQMLRQAYESTPLPIDWSRQRYWNESSSLTYIITRQRIEAALQRSEVPLVSYGLYFDANRFKDSASLTETMQRLRDGEDLTPSNPFIDDAPVITSDKLYLDIDTAKVDWAALNSVPSNRMTINLSGKTAIGLKDLMILEMLSNINDDNWNRSISFATTVDPNLYMNLTPNFTLEGMTYRITPGTPLNNKVNIEAAYDNVMNKFKWGGLDVNPDIYLDETCRRMVSAFRLYIGQIVDALIEEGEDEKALAMLDKCLAMIPPQSVPVEFDRVNFAQAYYILGEEEKAQQLMDLTLDRLNRNMDWFQRLSPRQIGYSVTDIIYYNVSPMLNIVSLYQDYDKDKYKDAVENMMNRARAMYMKNTPYVGDVILRELGDYAIIGYQVALKAEADDSSDDNKADLAIEEDVMRSVLHLMNECNPKLLDRYQQVLQED